MTLELKHLVGYLPHGLKFELNLKDVQVNYKNEIRRFTMTCSNVDLCLTHGGKPILRPLSDLTKEIDGVVHLVELAKIHDSEVEWIVCNNIATSKYGLHRFQFDGDFKVLFEYQPCRIYNQLLLLNYLFEHHFDVYGLIEKGLAIDINNIENV